MFPPGGEVGRRLDLKTSKSGTLDRPATIGMPARRRTIGYGSARPGRTPAGSRRTIWSRTRLIWESPCDSDAGPSEGHILLPIGTTSDCIGCRTSDGAVANSRSCYTGFDSQHWIRVHNCDYAKNL